jgi:hypothetical protein
MLYDLPSGPAIAVIGPEDTAWWAKLGEAPAGRYALVIGDRTTPRDAVVIAGSMSDIGAYLHPLHATLVNTVQQTYARISQHRTGDQTPARGVTPSTPTADPRPAVDLVTLPHTSIRVPDANLQVTAYRELPTPDGVAYTATVRLGRIPVGTLHNEGIGGLTSYHPAAGSPFGHRQLAVFVAASATADGQPISEEDLLEELVTEYENATHVAKAVRAGRSPLRLRAPLGEGDGLDDVYYTAERATTAKVTTPAQRDALVAQLRTTAVIDGAWWQPWTGHTWEDLTAPSQPAHGQDSPQ